jgi:chromosome segregation ATPase
VSRTASSDSASRDVRVRRLSAARARDSEAKTARSLGVVRDLLGSEHRVTFAGVAREAQVSTWFVYNQPQVRNAVQAAMDEQRGLGRQASLRSSSHRVTQSGLHTELALAREEIKDLKKERDRLRERVRLSLGAELDNVNRSQLIERVEQLEREKTDLKHELSAAREQLTALERRLQESEDDLIAARAGLRRAMRAVPSK